MIAPDANLLIYAYSPTDSFHPASRVWLENILSASKPVGLPILSIYAFLRVITHSRLPSGAITFRQAAEIVNSCLALPHVRILYPGDRRWLLLQRLSEQVRLSGPAITDASIARARPGIRRYDPYQ